MVFYVLMCLFLFLIQKTSLLSFFQLFSPSATLSCFVDRFLPVLYLTVCSCAEHSVYEIFKSRQVFAFPLQNHFPIFWEEKKKNPELPNKLNILILKLNCSFFFFSRTFWEKQQQQTADAGIWVGPECFSLGNQQHTVAVGHRGCILLSGLVCGAGDYLVEPQAFGVSFPNLIARGGMLVPLSFPPWV